MRVVLFVVAAVAGAFLARALLAPPALAGSGDGPSPRLAQVDGSRYSGSGYDITPLSAARVKALASKLSPEAYKITQQSDTEPAFCGTLLDNKKDGVYCCVVCGLPLYSSEDKFDSGTGWPSFDRAVDPDHIEKAVDTSFGLVRTKLSCARCGAHLGHVFNDGPTETKQRYCLNSASLTFHESGDALPAESRPVATEVAYFAGGCFWGLEHYFEMGPGVLDVVSGYMQGDDVDPDKDGVHPRQAGHAETVKVTYDPSRISYERLLEAFFTMHDPTQLNRQGPDIGLEYRSGIWYANDAQQRAAQAHIEKLASSDRFGSKPIVTQLEPAKTFFVAKDFHQDFIVRTGRPCWVKNPW